MSLVEINSFNSFVPYRIVPLFFCLWRDGVNDFITIAYSHLPHLLFYENFNNIPTAEAKYIIILKIGKSKICRGAVGRGWERFWEMFTSVGCVVGLWSTTHTSGGGDRSCKWSKHPTEVCLHAEMQRVCTCYTTEITIHCYTAKITLCLLVRDSCHGTVH